MDGRAPIFATGPSFGRGQARLRTSIPRTLAQSYAWPGGGDPDASAARSLVFIGPSAPSSELKVDLACRNPIGLATLPPRVLAVRNRSRLLTVIVAPRPDFTDRCAPVRHPTAGRCPGLALDRLARPATAGQPWETITRPCGALVRHHRPLDPGLVQAFGSGWLLRLRTPAPGRLTRPETRRPYPWD